MKKLNACILGLLLASLQPLGACLWDSDTLAAEVARFPGLAEVMTGQFPRHSREFYEWRRKQCEEALAKDPSQVHFYDDLAVAQHKLGDHKAAIETMLRKEKVKPDQYETYSNLGTFYIYTGELDKAVNWIHKALAINPNAHFGREKYQKWLVQWVMIRKGLAEDDKAGIQVEHQSRESPRGFARFVAVRQMHPARQQDPKEQVTLSKLQRNEAITGVLGMMRFADFDNPLLQEALGDLLISGHMEDNAAQMAAIAYLHASRKNNDAAEKERLFTKVKAALSMTMSAKELVSDGGENPLGKILEGGLAKGAAHAETIRAEELAWIAAGQDASAEFVKKYLTK